MKLQKIKLTELADAKLNEREMCRILGGGTPGCCQCGCHYITSGGSSTSNNDSANNSRGLVSDLGVQPCCPTQTTSDESWIHEERPISQDRICGYNTHPMC